MASTIVVAIALDRRRSDAGAGAANVQIRSIDSTLELRATDIETLIATDGGISSLSVEDDQDGFVQILDASGDVVAASRNIDGEPSLVTGTGDSTVTMKVIEVDTGDFRVHAHRTEGVDGATIVVGATLENVDRVPTTVRGSPSVRPAVAPRSDRGAGLGGGRASAQTGRGDQVGGGRHRRWGPASPCANARYQR